MHTVLVFSRNPKGKLYFETVQTNIVSEFAHIFCKTISQAHNETYLIIDQRLKVDEKRTANNIAQPFTEAIMLIPLTSDMMHPILARHGVKYATFTT